VNESGPFALQVLRPSAGAFVIHPPYGVVRVLGAILPFVAARRESGSDESAAW